METTKYKLKITFLVGPLGTQPQKDVATEYITSKAADPTTGELPADELETLPDALEKGTTAFHKLAGGQPIYYDYMLKGFLKEAGMVFNGLRGVKNLRSKIDNLVFVTPRQIILQKPETAFPYDANNPYSVTSCERPLRAMTAQGPRTALARSEQLPDGTWFECFLEVFNGQISEDILRDLLSYGEKKGLGQWRNGGRGTFTFELEAV